VRMKFPSGFPKAIASAPLLIVPEHNADEIRAQTVINHGSVP
jgi:hypothetical protein